jgi:hypothetical protein
VPRRPGQRFLGRTRHFIDVGGPVGSNAWMRRRIVAILQVPVLEQLAVPIGA